jgi:hypothetical protein
MEVWTLINKNNNKIIKYDIIGHDLEFGNLYYFVDPIEWEYSPIWFVNSEEEVKLAYKEWVHPQYCNNYKRPSTDKINIDDYIIKKFKMV